MIRLRKLERADKEQLLIWRNRPHVAKHMYTDKPISPDQHEIWFANCMEDDTKKLWVIENHSKDIGLVNLYNIDFHNKITSWAFYIGELDSLGGGAGAAVEVGIIKYCFEILKLNKIWCEVIEKNEAVWKLHERFGFLREAIFRDHIKRDDGFYNVIGLGLLSADYRKNPSKMIEKISRRFEVIVD